MSVGAAGLNTGYTSVLEVDEGISKREASLMRADVAEDAAMNFVLDEKALVGRMLPPMSDSMAAVRWVKWILMIW